MRTLDFPLDPLQSAPTVLIMLPGAFQQPEDLARHGMVDVVRAEGLLVDVVLADLGIRSTTDILDGTALRNLHTLATRARERNVQQVWLAGISIGGLIALRYAAGHAHGIDGIWLIGPYPGNRILLDEIRSLGGPRCWATSADAVSDADDGEACAWRWLAEREPALPPFIQLGWGADDRFAPGQQLIADTLPPDCGAVVPGAHDWPTWQAIWRQFMGHAAGMITSSHRGRTIHE